MTDAIWFSFPARERPTLIGTTFVGSSWRRSAVEPEVPALADGGSSTVVTAVAVAIISYGEIGRPRQPDGTFGVLARVFGPPNDYTLVLQGGSTVIMAG